MPILIGLIVIAAIWYFFGVMALVGTAAAIFLLFCLVSVFGD